MSSLNNGCDFIMDLSAERIFLSSIYATKATFIQCDRYCPFVSDHLKLDFIRQMSCWLEVVVVPITKRIVGMHKVSIVFQEIFKKEMEQYLSW